MENQTRIAFAKYQARQAQLNGVTDVSKKFTVEPSVQQKLENKIQESSAFLKQINIIGVDEMQGEKLGLGVSGPIAGRTDTSTKDRQTRDITTLDKQGYKLVQTNFDSHIRYPTLDVYAKFPDFQTRVRAVGIERQALDRIMIGFNGTTAAANTDPTTNPLLQDVNVGWLQHMRTDAPAQVKASANKIKADGTGDYKNLDALVFDVFNTNIEERYRNNVAFVAIMGSNLLQDKYFPLVNNNDKPTEMLSADLIISQKRVGNLQAVTVPFFPANAILITPLNNLSLYYQNNKRRMMIVDNPKRDRIETYESSNDGYVIETNERAALIENIAIE